MGGAINLVTRKPTESFQAEGGASIGADGSDASNAYFLAGARRESLYVQGSATHADRDSWDMSGDYAPLPGSLEDGGERLGSDSQDWRGNFKLGFTPNDGDEYTLNYTRQKGEKGAPLNVYNNPPVPPASFWRWPYWDVQNTSFLTSTQLGDSAYLKTKTYYNTFENGLDSFDDITYTPQNTGRGFFSPYDDHAYGTSVEFGTTRFASSTFKVAGHYRQDNHTEQQTSRPTSPTPVVEPEQEQAQKTWSLAAENTFHATAELDVVVGASYDEYRITEAQEFDATISPSVFEHPKGGSDAFNWQSAVIWPYRDGAQLHASISDRGRFPTFFELYSTRFGTATPNPDLGPERATNFEIGWETTTTGDTRIGGAVFYNDVEDLIQTVVLPDTTTQAQNVGNGRFTGVEVFFDAPISDRFRLGGNFTHIDLDIEDALQPDLRVDGVPENKGLLFASWRPVQRLTVTPSIEAADDRWSNVNPPVPDPYVATGAYTLVNFDGSYAFDNGLELGLGARNLLDENYELAWGFPEAGRSVYAKIRMSF
jgi:iron complex outermembrane receptor protein